mmetsp:Transcript_14596/g.38621  ORF Transcript_14596/g.38621 Transcript_14596/m.38621 type:complete len:209 (-) Transcript_14596:56-682(-)
MPGERVRCTSTSVAPRSAGCPTCSSGWLDCSKAARRRRSGSKKSSTKYTAISCVGCRRLRLRARARRGRRSGRHARPGPHSESAQRCVLLRNAGAGRRRAESSHVGAAEIRAARSRAGPAGRGRGTGPGAAREARRRAGVFLPPAVGRAVAPRGCEKNNGHQRPRRPVLSVILRRRRHGLARGVRRCPGVLRPQNRRARPEGGHDLQR